MPIKSLVSALSLLLALLTSPQALSTTALPRSVEQALSAAQIPLTHVSILVEPVERGSLTANKKSAVHDRTVAINTEQAMNPASVMKLLTTYTALNVLGPHWRWKTRLLTDSLPEGGVIEGSLFIQGGGDPKLTTEHLLASLRQLRVRGIQRIRGGIVLDRDAFALPAFNPAQFDELPMRPYNVGPDALLLSFHALTLSIEPTENTTLVHLETPLDGLTIDNQLNHAKTSCEDWKDQIQPQLQGHTGQWQLVLRGSFNRSCGSKTLNLSPFGSNDFAALLIRSLWKELGGTVDGEIRQGSVPNQATLLVENDSISLAEIVRDINKFSNNVMARQLFLSLAGQNPATLEEARSSTMQWLAANGLRFPELVIDNGSGLSRQERISAASLGKLLQHAWLSPVMPELVSSLPIVGLDGTMRKRLTNRQSTGRGHIKTGTLAGVKSIAGYAQNANGERFVVVFLINHPRAQQGQAAMDALLRWVMEER